MIVTQKRMLWVGVQARLLRNDFYEWKIPNQIRLISGHHQTENGRPEKLEVL